jgi:3,4-dihydroxyphenylacetate 2,3-dioxygenase
MGEVVGAAIVSHAPGIMLPEKIRRAMNEGQDTTLVSGLQRIRSEVLERLRPDTVVVFDTHWQVTFEHIIAAHPRRQGLFTSHELPRGMKQIPYDMPGDPDLATAVARLAAARDDTWVLACDDPYLPLFYGTLNIWSYLNRGERWVSVGVNQCAETADFLLLGELIGQAVAQLDRRVVLLASGGLSHRFLPFKELRGREAASLANIASPEARQADEHVLRLLRAGDHRAVIEWMPEFQRFAPEGGFGHYLMMAGALGGAACCAPATPFSEYEASVGTGQVQLWFERPAGGWTCPVQAA